MSKQPTYQTNRCQFCGTEARVMRNKKVCSTCNTFNIRAEKAGKPLLKPIQLSRILTPKELLEDEEYLEQRAKYRSELERTRKL